jgi:plastocyanin
MTDPDETHHRSGLPPLLYPVLAFAFGGALVWALSRILLAVSYQTFHIFGTTVKGKALTAVIGLLVAINVLVGSALVAYGQRVRRRPASFPVIVVAGLLVILGGVAALGIKRPLAEAKPQVLALDAQNTKFVQTTLMARAGAPVEVDFDNKDAGTPHNFVLFPGRTAGGNPLFRGQLVTGPTTIKYTFKAPPPGSYFFHCEVHPTQMTGMFVVSAGGGGTEAGGGPGGGSGGGPGATTITAKGLAFDPTSLTAPGTSMTIHFVNQDNAIPHNVVVFNGPDATAPVITTGPTITGPGSQDFSVTFPKAGTYFFHCQYHPEQMKGTITVP